MPSPPSEKRTSVGGTIRAWRERRREARWQRAIWRLGIPDDVAVRLRRIMDEPPDWYAGRTTHDE